MRKKVFDAVLKEADKASTLFDQNEDTRNNNDDVDAGNNNGSVESAASSSFANRLSGAPPPPLPLDKQHAHYLLDWRWVH